MPPPPGTTQPIARTGPEPSEVPWTCFTVEIPRNFQLEGLLCALSCMQRSPGGFHGDAQAVLPSFPRGEAESGATGLVPVSAPPLVSPSLPGR